MTASLALRFITRTIRALPPPPDYPADLQGNFPAATNVLLTKLDAQSASAAGGFRSNGAEDQKSYLYDGSTFHVLTIDGLMCVAMANVALTRVAAFGFLRELHSLWTGADSLFSLACFYEIKRAKPVRTVGMWTIYFFQEQIRTKISGSRPVPIK